MPRALPAERQEAWRPLEDTSYLVVAAQRFTPTMARTVEYLNAVLSGLQLYALELVRFGGDALAAFESRTVSKPQPAPAQAGGSLSESRFLAGIADEGYREALQELLGNCRSLGLRFEWGAAGASIRLPVPDRPEPVSIAWLFPPGVSGWMGLTDLSLGFDPAQAQKAPSAGPALRRYLEGVKGLPGAVPIGTFDGDGVQAALSLPADHQPLYLIPAGHPLG